MMAIETAQADLFLMPSLGADMDEGRITEWMVGVGDVVERGQIVVIVETDKSDIEVEVFDPGTVLEILADVGDMVPVGAPIARIGDPEHATTAIPPSPDVPGGATSGTVAEHQASHVSSPLIRHLADELHVDAAHLDGSGPGGRVRRDDVVAAATPAKPRPVVASRQRITPRARRIMSERGLDARAFADRAIVTGDDVSAEPAAAAAGPEPALTRAERMRVRIASLMSASWEQIPHYHVAKRIDLTASLDRLQQHNEERPLADRLVSGALLLCASARAAGAVRDCNGWWRGDHLEQADHVHLGVVLSLRAGGIIVPTIQHADQLSPPELMVRLTELVTRARQSRLKASDLAEATITVTNLGDLGADSVSGVIHPPQVALVGLGAVHDEVWAVDGEPVIRPTVQATLAGDHRATDGLAGSKLLAQMQTILDGPLLTEL